MATQTTLYNGPQQFTLSSVEERTLDAILTSTAGNDSTEHAAARDEIGLLISKITEGQLKVEGPIEHVLRKFIADLDSLIADQVSTILHHENFQRLEATWRGLHYLVRNTQMTGDIKLRILDVAREELDDDLILAKTVEESCFHKKVVTNVYEMAGGHPYCALIGDFEFDNSQRDIDCLSRIAEVATLAHAPFIASVSAQMFDLKDFTELPRVHIDLGVQFSKAKYINWNAFRETSESRYVGLVVPRFMVRTPYNSDNYKASFSFDEDVREGSHRKYLWANAAYAFGARLTEAYSMFGWTTAITGAESLGRDLHLPFHHFDTKEGGRGVKGPTEAPISAHRGAELADQGFIPLVGNSNADFATFFEAPSCQRPAVYESEKANTNARLATSLPCVFAASRFMHYIKVINRTKLGYFRNQKILEDYLNRWILNYVVGNEDASQELKANYPLQEARINIESVEGKPGYYRAVAYLKPHLHMERLTTTMRLVTELPMAKR